MSDGKSKMILIAGPYRSGTGDDPEKMKNNLRRMEDVALKIFRAGHIPMIGEWIALPLLEVAGSQKVGDTLYDEIVYPAAHRLLRRCDGIFRIEGESKGADEDVKLGLELNLPIYRNLDDIHKIS